MYIYLACLFKATILTFMMEQTCLDSHRFLRTQLPIAFYMHHLFPLLGFAEEGDNLEGFQSQIQTSLLSKGSKQENTLPQRIFKPKTVYINEVRIGTKIHIYLRICGILTCLPSTASSVLSSYLILHLYQTFRFYKLFFGFSFQFSPWSKKYAHRQTGVIQTHEQA